jgi:hypothetical protein
MMNFQPVLESWKLPSLAVPTGIIAGGAVRDFLLGAVPRDIDLFVTDSPEVREAIAMLGAKPVLKYCEHVVRYKRDSAYILQQAGDLPPLNIVVVKHQLDPKLLLDNFDFGICQAGWSAREGFRITDAFFSDAAAKTFTYRGPRILGNRSRRRYKDFVKRPPFAGWRLVGLSVDEPAGQEKPVYSECLQAPRSGDYG